MSQNEKRVPAIRFSEFSGEWMAMRLGEIGEFKTSSVDKKITKDEKTVNLVNYMDVYKHKTISKDICGTLMQVSAKEQQVHNNNLLKGDILFTPSSETPEDIGHSVVIPEDLPNTLYSYHVLRFRPKKIIDVGYSHYFCNIIGVRNQIIQCATGSTRYTVGIREFANVLVWLPSLSEQKRIAEFFVILDLKIQTQEAIVENLEKLKKGYMQKIFSQELRFKDENGEDFPEWEERRLGDVAEFLPKNNRLASSGQSKGKYPFYTNSTKKVNLLIDEYDADGEYVISNTGGKSYFDYAEGKFACMSDCLVFKNKYGSSKYLYFLLTYMNEYINYVGYTGSGLNHLDRGWFNSLELMVPCENEQAVISEFLSLVSNRIDNAIEVAEHLKNMKKGYLQEMFV